MGFEKNPLEINKKIQAQDPSEKINLGEGVAKRPTYISVKIEPGMKKNVVELLKEYKDYFAWDYKEILGLS